MFSSPRALCLLPVANIHTRNFFISAKSLQSDDRPSKTEWYTPDEIKKESWQVPEQKEVLPEREWRSVFHRFRPKGVSRETVLFLQKGFDFQSKTIQEWMNDKLEESTVVDQSFRKDRVSALGFDLAAAHFLVHRGGRVRFRNAQEWIQQAEDESYSLSPHFTPGIFLEAIDASGTDLIYEGLESMKQLKHLKWLSVSSCPNIDDWCIDRICAEYCNTLQHLDISHCPKITERGIAAIARLRELRSLNLTGLDHIQDINLLCILLEDSLPNLEISGINYMDNKLQ